VWKTGTMLILASESSARKSLLDGAGLHFEAMVSGLDERAVENAAAGLPAEELAQRLAEAKAEAVATRFPGAVVIGADQILTLDGERLHKPRDFGEAKAQLARLGGRTHDLYAGIAIAIDGKAVWSHVAAASLTMRHFSGAERDAVLALEGDAALGAVGSYRLEGPSIRLFEAIHGDYFTILGLPLLPLLAALRIHAPTVFEEFVA
jgi:septum formation protein